MSTLEQTREHVSGDLMDNMARALTGSANIGSKDSEIVRLKRQKAELVEAIGHHVNWLRNEAEWLGTTGRKATQCAILKQAVALEAIVAGAMR